MRRPSAVPFEATVNSFVEALADPARLAPAETLGREGRPDARRFAVYRNNVAVGLIGALEMRYPVTRRLVGDAFFRGLARAFIAGNKPSSAVLIHYGAAFADFIENFEPAREIPYLPDVARLENAWVEAYHAAEAKPLGLGDLAAIDPERLGELVFTFHPAVRLIRLAHPAASIWAGHQGPGEPRAPERWAPEDALIARPDADVAVRILPAGGHGFAAALMAGASINEAAAPLADEGVDPGPHLVGLIEAGALTSFR
jgi:Putative DNA-binding domain